MGLGVAGKGTILSASSQGLGRTYTQALAAAGANIVINGRDARLTIGALRPILTGTEISIRILRRPAHGEAQAARMGA